MVKKNILIIADVYPPEISSAAHLMQELAEGMRDRGYNVTVVTAYPRHYLNEVGKRKTFSVLTDENGIKVIRVKTLPHHKINFIIRGIAQLILPFLFFQKIKRFIRDNKINVVFIYSPPLPLGLVGGLVKKRYGAKFILNLQDFFPQNAIDLGILKNRLLIKFFEWLERKIYLQADKITFHSEGGCRFLIEKKRVPPEKIVKLPNWIETRPFEEPAENISFRRKYSLENKFIFLFAGIIGPAQGLDFLIEVAKKVSDIKDIVFLLVGDGTERNKIEALIKNYGLQNVLIKSFVSKEAYPCLVRDCDVGLVCLSVKNKTSFIPGKFLGYLAAAKPVLAFLNKESDGFDLIKEAQCGYAVETGDLNAAEAAVRLMYQQKNALNNFGWAGKNYLLLHFSAKVIFDKIETLLS